MTRQIIELFEPVQAHGVLTKVLWPQAKALLMAGNRLQIELRLSEDVLTDKQRRYLHGFILKTIAEQALVNGERFPLKVWKEFLRDKFLGHKVVTTKNPMTGKKVRRRVRVSTEDLGVKGYAEYIDRVAAFAATDLGIEFAEEWCDPETGEIYRLDDQRRHKVARRAAKSEQGAEVAA